jgi:hypothetical protein
MSTNDTVTFAGTERKEAAWWMVGTNSLAKAGTNSKYCRDDSGYLNGRCVKDTYTFSAAGTAVVDLFVSICGLTETELPKEKCPDRILKIKIDVLEGPESPLAAKALANRQR